MADSRDVDLTIRAKMESEEAARKAADLNKTIKGTGDAAAETAGDLQKVAGALDEVAQGEGQVAAGAQQAAQNASAATGALADLGAAGTTAATSIAQQAGSAAAGVGKIGDAALEGASETEDAAETIERSIAEITAEWQKEIEAAKAAGKAFTPEQTANALRDLAAQIRASTDSLEDQKAALQGLAAGALEDLNALKSLGSGGSAEFTKIEAAVGDVQTAITQVGAEIDKITPKTKPPADGFDEIKTASVSFAVAAKGAIADVNAVTEQFNDQQRITPKLLNDAQQAMAALGMTMREEAAAGREFTTAETELVARLETQLGSLTTKANELQNAAKDSAVGLREQGDQAALLASSVGGLVSVFDQQQIMQTALIGKTATLSRSFENLRDVAKQLHLNTFGVHTVTKEVTDAVTGQNVVTAVQAKNLLGSAGAYALLVGAALAAVKVGKDVSETATGNTEAYADMGKAIRFLFRDFANFKDRLAGTQEELTKLIAGQGSVAALSIGMARGGAAARVYYDLLNRGIPTQQAIKIATDDSRVAIEAYQYVLQAGQRGQQLWTDALRQSGGDSEKLKLALTRLKVTLEDDIRIQKLATGAKGAYADSLGLVIDRIGIYGDRENRILSASEENIARVSQANRVLEEAVNGRTQAIDTSLSIIEKLLVASDLNAEKLRAEAAALADVAANTDNLNTDDRARLEILNELISKGEELDASQVALALSLIKQIEASERATAAGNILAEVHAQLDTAIGGTTKELDAQLDAIGQLINEGWALNSVALAKVFADMQTTLDGTNKLSDGQRKLHQTILDGFDKINGLTNSLKSLRDRQIELVDVGQQMTKQQLAEYEANRVKISSIETEIGFQKAVIGVSKENIEQMKAREKAQASAVISTNAIIKTEKDGITTYTNVKDATAQAGDATKTAAERVAAAAQTVSPAYQKWLDEAKKTKGAGEVAEEVADKTEGAAKKIGTSWNSAATATGAAVENFGRIRISISDIVATLPSHTKQVNDLADAYDRLATNSAKAAGTSGGGVSDTGLEPR